MITVDTTFYVLTKTTGVGAQLTGREFVDAFKGGMKWEDIEVTLDETEAGQLGVKHQAIVHATEILRAMTADEATAAVALIAKDGGEPVVPLAPP